VALQYLLWRKSYLWDSKLSSAPSAMISEQQVCIGGKHSNHSKLKETRYLTVPKCIRIAYQLVEAERVRMWCSEYRGWKLSHNKPGYMVELGWDT
jgi:hypothetical protein